jgi:hypothetical protein
LTDEPEEDRHVQGDSSAGRLDIFARNVQELKSLELEVVPGRPATSKGNSVNVWDEMWVDLSPNQKKYII